MELFIDVYLKIFFVLTPFFVLSAFLSLTRDKQEAARRQLALKVTAAVVVIVFALFLFGQYIFAVFGVTVDAFKIGAGVLLFLSAISLVQGRPAESGPNNGDDIAVVPLAMPVMVGPATTGVLLVMGTDLASMHEKVIASAALLSAVLTVSALLLLASTIEKRLGALGLSILSKLTGLMLASIAAQLILTGTRHFLR